jgi:hypothetical protein
LPLAALIAAQDEAESGDGLRATLPLAGRSLVEYQADLALRAGADHVILLVERVPAALAEAAERLRRRGLRIGIARGVADAIGRLHPEERILLITDGAVVAQEAADMLAAQPGPALLTVPDVAEHAAFERIDATQRWAGFALLDKASLEATARMLGDWDLSSTLLRRLVQSGAVRIDALASDGGRPLAPPLLATDPAALAALEASLLRRGEPAGGNWTERYLHRLLAAPLVGPLLARRVDRRHVAIGAVAIAWAGALLAAFDLFWGAALLLPLAAAIAATARRMARIWTGPAEPERLLAAARQAAGLAALALLARMLAAAGGWGWWLAAAVPPLALAGLAGLQPIAARLRIAGAPRWSASADALAWLAPLLALLGGWEAMVAALACYAASSFAQRFIAAWRAARNYDNEV